MFFLQDLKFICSHEPWLSWTTNIAEKFPDRKKTYNMDDDDENFNWNDKGDVTDEWFSFDFTLAELKTLRKKQSNEFRDPRYDGQERVVTLEELVDITRYVYKIIKFKEKVFSSPREYGENQERTIGIYPELKHSHAVNKVQVHNINGK